MKLAEFQRAFFDLIRQPLTAAGGQRSHALGGQAVKMIAEGLVTPGPRLTPFERLELYSQGYWFRLLDVLREDFAGLRALLGRHPFEQLAAAYLADCPPDSFDLRRVGARLEGWLANHLHYAARREGAALDMVRLESAEIETRDAIESPSLSAAELGELAADPSLELQPHLRLLDLAYPVDALLAETRRRTAERTPAARPTAAAEGGAKRRARPRVRRALIPQPENVFLAVHRYEQSIYHKRLAPEAFVLLRALQQGRTLSEAIAAAVDNAGDGKVDEIAGRLQQWFAEWAALGWFCRKPAKPVRAAA